LRENKNKPAKENKNLLYHSSILTIVHRIKAVLNSDRILVLDNGEIKEFDSPQTLLKNKKFFYKLYNNVKVKIIKSNY